MLTLPARLRDRLPRFLHDPSGFARSVAMLTGSTMLGQGVGLALAPLLTRIYDPSQFGVLGTYAAIVSVLGVAGSLRYEAAIPVAPDDRTARDLSLLSLLIVAAATAALIAFVALGLGPLASALDLAYLDGIAWFIPLGFVAAAIYQLLTSVTLRLQGFASIARTKIMQGASLPLSQLVLGLLSPTTFSLLVSDVIGRAAGSGTLGLFVLRSRKALPRPSLRGLLEVAAKYRHFPLFSCPAYTLNTLSLHLPPILLASSFGTAVAGFYVLSQRVVGLPMRLLGQSIAEVYTGRAAALIREGDATVTTLFDRIALRLAAAGALPSLALLVAGPLLFEWVFGEGWAESGTYVALLIPASFAQFVFSPLSQTLIFIERQRDQLALDVVRTSASCLALLAPAWVDASPRTAILLYSLSMFGSYALGLFWTRYQLRRFRRSIAEAPLDPAP